MCASDGDTPKMNDFVYSKCNDVWSLTIKTSTNTQREVVVPNAVIPYLIEYRRQRWLKDLPDPSDTSPLLSNIRPKSLTQDEKYTWPETPILVWTASNDVRRVLDETVRRLKLDKTNNKDQILVSDIESIAKASSRWLRHSGAAAAIKSGTSLLNVSKDLGHKDVRTTQIGYVSNELNNDINLTKKRSI
jgi:integrase